MRMQFQQDYGEFEKDYGEFEKDYGEFEKDYGEFEKEYGEFQQEYGEFQRDAHAVSTRCACSFDEMRMQLKKVYEKRQLRGVA